MLTVFDFLGCISSVLVLWVILKARIRKYSSLHQKTFIKAFYFKVICSILFALITAYYYQGGDSEMFLYAVRDMKLAVQAKQLSFSDLLFMEKVDDQHPLSYFFQQDNLKYPVIGFMRHAPNFMVPKLGLIPYLIFFNSYMAMALFFSFFALGGAIRLYKLMLYYFPHLQKEVALATLFLPSVCYWSSGFLKDSLCLGAIGFLLYGLLNIFILRKEQLFSFIWVLISCYILYTTKVYILLALIPGIGFWLFGELSSGIKSIALKRFITAVTLLIAAFAAFYFVNYLTSETALSKFSVDNILETSDYSRKIFERRGDEGSSFQLNTTNPALLFLNGMVATFFRPFPWEINSFIVLFSALESFIFLSLLVYLFYNKGFIAPIKKIFDTPILVLSFSFAIIFAVSIGISTTNFGSLSRYKIPCLPFYLMFVLGAYNLTDLGYPMWMNRILSIFKTS